MIALGKPLGCCVHRCDELNPSPCLPLHLTHRHAPFSQCGWFHLLACHDVMSKSLSYPSRQGFQRQSLGLMPRWTEPLRWRISTLACRGGVPVLRMSCVPPYCPIRAGLVRDFEAAFHTIEPNGHSMRDGVSRLQLVRASCRERVCL